MKLPLMNLRWAKYPLGDVTQWFGENPDLYQKHGRMKGHNGIDLVRPWGEHLFSVADGIIVDLKDTPEGYGKHIRILENVDGKEYREWVYGHMSHINVTLGQEVHAGQYVGNIGNTGFVVSNSTGNGFWDVNPYAGTHVHFGVRRVYKSPTGWKYPGASIKVHVHDYENGYKGSINPLPLFMPPELTSSKIVALGSMRKSKTLVDFGYLLKGLNI